MISKKVVLWSFVSLLPIMAFAASHLSGPVYFESTPSRTPRDCRIELNRAVAENCNTHLADQYTLVSESSSTNYEMNFGECEAHFKAGYAVIQWDVAPGFGKNFSLVGLNCPSK